MRAKSATPNVDKSAPRVRKMFGEIAPKYDLLNGVLSVGLATGWRRRFVAEVLRRLDENVKIVEKNTNAASSVETLDVATGTGDVVRELLRQWKRRENRNRTFAQTLQTIGADFVPEMLEIARKKVPNVEFLEADATELPFESNRFDAATISFGLRNTVDPERCVAEMARVCKPGGIVAILEFAPPRFPIFAQLFRFYFHRILPLIGAAVARDKSNAYRYLPESVDAFDSPEKVLEKMQKNGVESPIKIPLTFGVANVFIGRKQSTFSST